MIDITVAWEVGYKSQLDTISAPVAQADKTIGQEPDDDGLNSSQLHISSTMYRKRGFRYKVIFVFDEINQINKCYKCARHSILSNRHSVVGSEMQILIGRFMSNLRIPFTASFAMPSCSVSGLSSSSILKQFTKHRVVKGFPV
ncbi:MAG: hypothetical protein WBP64_11780 [Nitrososphaeraceae archaeon]